MPSDHSLDDSDQTSTRCTKCFTKSAQGILNDSSTLCIKQHTSYSKHLYGAHRADCRQTLIKYLRLASEDHLSFNMRRKVTQLSWKCIITKPLSPKLDSRYKVDWNAKKKIKQHQITEISNVDCKSFLGFHGS